MIEIRYIRSIYAILPDTDVRNHRKCANLKSYQKKFLEHRIRRIGSVSHLACLAAAGCLHHATEFKVRGERIGIFHGTSLGNIAETLRVAEESLGISRELPSPINFSSSVSNNTAFYIASVTGALGPNILISQEDLSFEGALNAFQLTAGSGKIDAALVGGTDGFIEPPENQLIRYGYEPGISLGEGSGWMLLDACRDNALGEFLHCEERIPDSPEQLTGLLRELISRFRAGEEPVHISLGTRFLKDDILTQFIRDNSLIPMDYHTTTGHYPTAAASSIYLAGRNITHGIYLHISKNIFGRIGIFLIRFFPKI